MRHWIEINRARCSHSGRRLPVLRQALQGRAASREPFATQTSLIKARPLAGSAPPFTRFYNRSQNNPLCRYRSDIGKFLDKENHSLVSPRLAIHWQLFFIFGKDQ